MKISNERRAGSVRRRLLLLLLPPLAVLLVAGVLVDYWTGDAPVREAYDQALTDAALAVSAHLHVELGRVLIDLPPEAVAVLRTDSHDEIFYLVLDPQGRYVGGDQGLPTAPTEAQNPTYADAEYHNKRIRVSTYRVALEVGQVGITVAETTHKRESAFTRLLSGAILTDVLQLAATLLLVYVGIARGLRPLLRLRDEIETRSPRDLRAFDEHSVPMEVQPLVHALNQLFVTVRDAALTQQQFLANAAHQVRTPIAGLQAQLELLTRDPALESRHVLFQQLLDNCRRLGHTANQLLALARADPAANLPERFDRVDLRVLVEQCASEYLSLAIKRGIELDIDVRPASIVGSHWLLREALNNLCVNALNYTASGGAVTLRCDNTAAGAFVEVADNGSGIPPEAQQRVFERFYRLPGNAQDGSGLGLAIVMEIVDVHQAKLSMESNAQGTRIRIDFEKR